MRRDDLSVEGGRSLQDNGFRSGDAADQQGPSRDAYRNRVVHGGPQSMSEDDSTSETSQIGAPLLHVGKFTANRKSNAGAAGDLRDCSKAKMVTIRYVRLRSCAQTSRNPRLISSSTCLQLRFQLSGSTTSARLTDRE